MCYLCEELLLRLKPIPIKYKEYEKSLQLVVIACFSIVHTVPLSEVKYCPICGKEIQAIPVDKKNTHVVLDLFYHPDEEQECFQGTCQECHDFVAQQTLDFMYKVVPLIK